MGFKKRQMVFIPEVNPTSFVFFFEKGDSGLSWSIYDYSADGPPPKRFDRSDFPWTAPDIRDKAIRSLDAPTVGTNEYAFWDQHTLDLNQTYLAEPAEAQGRSGVENGQRHEPGEIESRLVQPICRFRSSIWTNSELPPRAARLRTWSASLFGQQRRLGDVEFLSDHADPISNGLVGPLGSGCSPP